MIPRTFIILALIAACATACTPAPVDFGATATQAALNLFATQTAAAFTPRPSTPTFTAAPPPVVSETPSPTAAPPPQAEMQLIAYVRDEQLVVTDVTNGVQGGTTQYTVQGESDKVSDIAWSPSGEFVAFTSAAQGDPRVFYIFALGQSSPTDFGPGSSPAWSPDSQSLAFVGGTFPDENVWVTTIENPAPRQLTFETNYAWGRPAFTPDGQALIVAGADRFNMGAQGNTTFTLERLALDGRGTRTPLPGAAPVDGSRLPYDLHFSPDGSKLAYSTSMHISACASLGAYYVSSPDGGNRAEYISPSLKELVDPGKERYFVGLNYAWSPTSNALVIAGTVVDCDPNSATMGQVIGGPQISLLQLDGITEGPIIPGRFFGLSMDRTGTLIAGANYMDLQSPNATVELYSAQTGQLVLSLGTGNFPQFQP